MRKPKKEKKKKSLWRLLLLGLVYLVVIVVGWLYIMSPIWLPIMFLLTPFGTFYETDPSKYVQVMDYLSESIDEYTVNEYSKTQYEYLDSCRELFLDLTVTEEQFSALIEEARSGVYLERECYYAEGYYEIVYCDEYETFADDDRVGLACIEKVIYNSETNNVIYECFHADDSSVYALEDVAYFRRFQIDEKEYVEYLP